MNIQLAFQSKPFRAYYRGGAWQLETISGIAAQHVPGEMLYALGRRNIPLLSKDQLHLVTEVGPYETYDPITEAPKAYLAFAHLRDDLWADSDKPLSITDHWHNLQGFMEKYGPPIVPLTFRLPEKYGIEYADGFLLEEVLEEAALLAGAVRCYQSLDESGERFRSALTRYFQEMKWLSFEVEVRRGLQRTLDVSNEKDLLMAARIWLTDCLNTHARALAGIHPHAYFDPKNLWQQEWTYSELASLMWLQLYQAILRHSPIRQCDGCQNPFEVLNRSDQVYCEVSCRNKANARRTYLRRKGGQGLSTEA